MRSWRPLKAARITYVRDGLVARLIGGSVWRRGRRGPRVRVHRGTHYAGGLLEEIASIEFEIVGHCGIRMRTNCIAIRAISIIVSGPPSG